MTDSTQITRLIRPVMLAIVFSLLAVACESTTPWYRSEPEVAITPRPEVPESFLSTDHEVLAAWLEDRFKVEYRNITPSLIFEQEPINAINYDTVNLPPDSEYFELKSLDISRREILYRVAQNWALTMTIEEENGVPSIVRVVGKGNQITNEANFPPEPESDIPGGPGF